MRYDFGSGYVSTKCVCTICTIFSGRQSHRSNPPSTTAVEYYRISLYNEFLSHVLAELEQRIVNNPSHDIAIGLLYLVPSECVQYSEESDLPDELNKIC